MDLKIKIIIVLLLGLWFATIFESVMFNIAIGLSAWTWLGITAWYSLRIKDSSEQESVQWMFNEWEWA